MATYSQSDLSIEILGSELSDSQKFEKKYQQSERLRKQELIIFSNKEKQVVAGIQKLQNELINLSNQVANISSEIKTTIVQPLPANPGTYHISFFEKLVAFVKSLLKQTQQASYWLSEFKTYGKKKSHYWSNIKKSGSKYLLSADRYMSTQAG